MTEKPLTRLDDARALKRMNIPLNTPVEHRTFSKAYSKHWFAQMNAHTEFMLAMREYCDDADPRPGKWKLVRRRFVALDKAAVRCFDFVAELGGNVPVGAEPVFKSEQDAHEYVLLGAFIAERALPFIEFWADAVDVVEASGTLTITASDIPRWVDEDTA